MAAAAEVIIPIENVAELSFARTAEIGYRGCEGVGSCQDEWRSLVQSYANGIESAFAKGAAAVIEVEHADHRIIGLYLRVDRREGYPGMSAGRAFFATSQDEEE